MLVCVMCAPVLSSTILCLYCECYFCMLCLCDFKFMNCFSYTGLYRLGSAVQIIMPVAVAAGQEVCMWAHLVSSAGMNMPLHQISVIPRDVTSSRVSGSGKAKDKDKQVGLDVCVFLCVFSVCVLCGSVCAILKHSYSYTGTIRHSLSHSIKKSYTY